MRGFRKSISDDQSVFMRRETAGEVGYSRAKPVVSDDVSDSPSCTCVNVLSAALDKVEEEEKDENETPGGGSVDEIVQRSNNSNSTLQKRVEIGSIFGIRW